ncbi:MAG: hypothetical protein E4H14_09075 [Candidatus Thorarchaeota archaeon]|nr:MAG: hypothetical protein E4H14_09075 [Candidatus Thorarchaeota archaeon]
MSKLDRGLPEWASYLLKALFVMIFPLSISINDFMQILFLPSTGLLFPSLVYFPETLYDLSFAFSMLSIILRNFLIGIIIAVPGIYYNYKLSRTPLHTSFWKRGIGFSAAIFFITLGITLFLSQYMYSPFTPYNDDFWSIYNKILYYPSLVIGVFIILPLVLRQAVIISVPSGLHYYSMRDIESSPKFNLSREKMLSAIFWLFICFAPYSIQYNMYSWYGGYMSTSFLMDYRIESNWYGSFDIPNLYFTGQIAMVPNIPFFALLFIFHFAFVRDVYRYLRKTITRNRLIGMAIFSCLFPVIFSFGLGGMFIFGYLVYLPIPIPLIQIVGLLLVRYHRPDIVQSERVWKGDKSTMWWETERREQPIQISTTPEKPFKHREEVITVPVRDLFLSRIRKLKSRHTHEQE